jgi:hypothetical protein
VGPRAKQTGGGAALPGTGHRFAPAACLLCCCCRGLLLPPSSGSLQLSIVRSQATTPPRLLRLCECEARELATATPRALEWNEPCRSAAAGYVYARYPCFLLRRLGAVGLYVYVSIIYGCHDVYV